MLRFEEPSQYVRANYERRDRLAVVMNYRNSGRIHSEIATAEKISSTAFQARLWAANCFGADIYITANTLSPGATGRTKAEIEEVRHVSLDLEGTGKESLKRILNAPGLPPPHHILNASPEKYQFLWSVTGFNRDQAEMLMCGLATQTGGALVWDTAGITRLPGFQNHECVAVRHCVRDLQEHPPSVRDYRAEDFPKLVGERNAAPLRATGKVATADWHDLRTGGTGPRSVLSAQRGGHRNRWFRNRAAATG